jgi:hypothetical protein
MDMVDAGYLPESPAKMLKSLADFELILYTSFDTAPLGRKCRPLNIISTKMPPRWGDGHNLS